MDDQEKRRRMRARSKAVTEKKRLKYECAVCGFNVVVAAHHIRPVSKGGRSRWTNLISLCPNCHATVHKIRRESYWLRADDWYRIDNFDWLRLERFLAFYSIEQVAFLISIAAESLLALLGGGRRRVKWSSDVIILDALKNYIEKEKSHE